MKRQAITEMLRRIPMPRAPQTLYKLALESPERGFQTSVAETKLRFGRGQFQSALNALARRINGTPGYSQEKRPGLSLVFTRTREGERDLLVPTAELIESIRAIPELVLALRCWPDVLSGREISLDSGRGVETQADSESMARELLAERLQSFEEQTASLPRSTEVERLTIQRVGQSLFRDALLGYWGGRCAVTDLDLPELLRASHIKPWSDCATDIERLDVFNGILLAPQIDAAFDCGLATFADDGSIIIADDIHEAACRALALVPSMKFRIDDRHRAYLQWHRTRVFRRTSNLGEGGS